MAPPNQTPEIIDAEFCPVERAAFQVKRTREPPPRPDDPDPIMDAVWAKSGWFVPMSFFIVWALWVRLKRTIARAIWDARWKRQRQSLATALEAGLERVSFAGSAAERLEPPA